MRQIAVSINTSADVRRAQWQRIHRIGLRVIAFRPGTPAGRPDDLVAANLLPSGPMLMTSVFW